MGEKVERKELSTIDLYARRSTQMGRNMANIYDVAKRAGVSKTLVSRVINHQSGVSPESREKISEAMRELKYTPNGVARSLVLQRTFIIGVILDSLSEPYFFDFIEGIEREIAESDYRVIFCSGQSSRKLKDEYIDFFAQGRTDGAIIYGSNLDDVEMIEQRSLAAFPFVVVENDVRGLNVNNVVIDNAYGSRLAVEHLISGGCRTILHVTGAMNVRASIDRKDGYLDTMKEHGLQPEVLNCNEFGVKEGYRIIEQYIKTRGRDAIPDAIYFGADNTAFGGMMALEDAGISVPGEIKIAGFDDDKPRDITRKLPKLTTLHQPLHEMGRKAVQILIHQLGHPQENKSQIVLQPELVIRDTT